MFDLFQLRIIFIEWVDSILESIQHCYLSWNDLRVDLEEEEESEESEEEEEEEEEEEDLDEMDDTITVCSESELDDLCISESESESEFDPNDHSVWPNTLHLLSFKTPTEWAEMSDKRCTGGASSMRKGVIYSEPDYMPRLVSIEGNIGAGKTTLIRKLQEKYNNSKNKSAHILFLPEPVAFWQTFADAEKEKNILELFYENPKKYAFAFQMLAFQSRYELLRNTIENIRKEGTPIDTIVMERSLDADYHIFAKTMFENGTLEEIEWDIYRFVTRERLAEFGVSGIIWLDVPAEECYLRVQERAREEEGELTLDYLRSCEEAHREWLSADLGFVCRVEDALHSEEDITAIDTYLF